MASKIRKMFRGVELFVLKTKNCLLLYLLSLILSKKLDLAVAKTQRYPIAAVDSLLSISNRLQEADI